MKVVASAPPCSAPWTAPAAPASDCISTISGTCPHRFGSPGRRPRVGELAHRAGRSDRVDGDHLGQLVRDARRRLVAVDHEALRLSLRLHVWKLGGSALGVVGETREPCQGELL